MADSCDTDKCFSALASMSEFSGLRDYTTSSMVALSNLISKQGRELVSTVPVESIVQAVLNAKNLPYFYDSRVFWRLPSIKFAESWLRACYPRWREDVFISVNGNKFKNPYYALIMRRRIRPDEKIGRRLFVGGYSFEYSDVLPATPHVFDDRLASAVYAYIYHTMLLENADAFASLDHAFLTMRQPETTGTLRGAELEDDVDVASSDDEEPDPHAEHDGPADRAKSPQFILRPEPDDKVFISRFPLPRLSIVFPYAVFKQDSYDTKFDHFDITVDYGLLNTALPQFSSDL